MRQGMSVIMPWWLFFKRRDKVKFCRKCNESVANGDPERKVVGENVYHGKCYRKLPMNTRVRTPEQQQLRLVPRL